MPNKNTTKNFYWPDGSGFCFDLAPKDVTGGWDAEVTGGPYDIPNLPFNEYAGGYNGWTNWLDKAQKDYRFANVSDSNAVCNLFPEVDDPWMFTEYVYEGVPRDSDLSLTNGSPISIIEPPLTKPHLVSRTLHPDGTISTSALVLFNEEYTTRIQAEQRYAFEEEHRWKSAVPPFNLFWESELDALGWVERVPPTNQANADFERLPEVRRRIRFTHPSNNAGVRLNRRKVWATSTRWGQSQNIPERVITMTGPPDWFRATEMFTSRIVPHIEIIKGQPIYDVSPSVGGQGVVYYKDVVEGQWSWTDRIGMGAVVPAGTNGASDSLFTYAVPAGITGLALCVLPAKPEGNEPRLVWTGTRFTTGDLIHRGCAFWKGSGGTCQCDYARQQSGKFIPRDTQVNNYFYPDSASFDVSLSRAILASEESVEVHFSDNVNGPWIDESAACHKVVLVATQAQSTIGSISIVKTAGTPPTITCFRVRIVPRERPTPHNTLCAFSDDAKDQKSAYLQKCRASGVAPCSFFTSQGAQILATYEGIASNGAEWANLQRGLPQTQSSSTTDAATGKTTTVQQPYKKNPYDTAQSQAMMDMAGASGTLGAGVGAMMAYRFAGEVMTPDAYTSGIPKEEVTRYAITYEPEKIPVSGKIKYHDTPDGLPSSKDPEGKIKLQRGSGFHLIDWKDQEGYDGVDGLFFGMVNQINYRIMHSVQHCYRADKCDAIILGRPIAPGWRRGQYAGVDFTNHPLKMPGYPAHDAHSEFCPYGNFRCPKTNSDRRAVEYDANYRILIDEILIPFRALGISAFTGTLQEAFIIDGKVKFLASNALASNPNAMCVAVQLASETPPILGHWQPVVLDEAGVGWRIYFYYDRPSADPLHKKCRVSAHILQFDANEQPCYAPLPESDRAVLATMFANPDTIPWLTELNDDYQQPIGNNLHATNGKGFAGGRAPEYTDHSKRGRQLVCTFGGNGGLEGADGASWTNQFGGPAWNRSPARSQGRMGYWTDRYGEMILGSTPIPTVGTQTPSPYVSVSSRIRNKVSWSGGAVPIDGSPSLTIKNDDDPTRNKESDFASVGHTFSTDTAALHDWFREDIGGETRWHSMLPPDPMDPDGGKIKCAPPSPIKEYLPLERKWFRCTVCGIDFSEEEANFLRMTLPNMCDRPAGAPSQSPCGCPRHDGGWLADMGPYTHFLDTHARGEVDVWAPPGTTVRRDGFFWKNPTLVSRAHGDQITHKLGGYHAVTKGYDFDDFDPDVERMGRLPLITDHYYNPGLSRQLTAPWARAGDTASAIRARIAQAMDLIDTDYSKVLRVNASVPAKLEPQNESTTILALGDQIAFYRLDVHGKEFMVGMPVRAIWGADTSIMQEAIVKSDTAMPVRTDYPSGNQGEKLYRDARRQWLIGVVQGSLYNWATAANVGASPNPLADALAAHGIDPDLGHSLDPKTGAVIEVDERIIGPYARQEAGSLKMVTLPHMKRLRNRILPMLAYNLADPDGGYTAGGDYTREAQASNLDRFSRTKKTLPARRPGQIPPQVLAATSSGLDYFVEWETDDVLGTKVRAYYPVGTTWWRMNQKVGQIRRSGGTNALHLDDSSRVPVNSSALGVCYYTGDTISSACAFFLHGRIPMDKEVVKAYVVYTTEPGPYAAALGCQGSYTGYRAPVMGGEAVWSEKEYKGHGSCFWQHYHPWTMENEHEANSGGTTGYSSYWGPASKFHVDKFSQWTMKYELGSTSVQSSDPVVVAQETEAGADAPTGYQPWVNDNEQLNYLDQVDILSLSFVDREHGFRLTQPFFEPWHWGQDLRQTMTEYEVWKDITFSKYEELKARYHTVVCAAINTDEALHSFDYFAAEFRNRIWPNEQQGIPGWIDMTNYSTSGGFGRKVDIAAKTTDSNWADGPQVIVQAYDPTGGNGIGQAGDLERVIDCTETIRKAYADRVTRFYQCKLGWSYAELGTKIPALTDTNLGNAARMHSGYDEPMRFWNYRYVEPGVGMWLNDPWHHTPTLNDLPVGVGADGDPISQTSIDKRLRVSSVSEWDTQGLAEADADYLKFHPWSLCQSSQDFDENSPLISPAPADSSARYWRVASDKPTVQSFEMDLRQTPLEIMRRPWRYRRAQVDSTPATCPNVSKCWIAEQGLTVGQVYERATSTWGTNLIPSTSSEYCAYCGAKLQGVNYVDGDGITTVQYDPAFKDDVLIAGVQVGVMVNDGWMSQARHGFLIEYYNSLARTWSALFSVDWDEATSKYRYPKWNGSAWITESASLLPATFVGAESSGNGTPKDAGTACHFISVAAAKVRFRVLKPAKIAMREPATPGTYHSGTVQGGGLKVTSLSQTLARYVHRTITVTDAVSGNFRSMTITQAENTPGGYLLTLSGSLKDTETSYAMDWTDHVVRCTRFRVFGWPYRAGDLVITPPAFVQPIFFSPGNNTFRLNSWATKVLKVEAASGTRAGVNLSYTESTGNDFLWEVEAVTWGGVQYLEIKGGKYAFDHRCNSIIIPAHFIDPTSGARTSIWALNEDLYNDAFSNFDLQTLPRQLMVEYFTGLGIGITVNVEAAGLGPSYQVETDSVCFIAGHSDDIETTPAYVRSNASVLPPMGNSMRIATHDDQPFPLLWHVYNHEPIIWDYDMRWLTGDELGKGEWGDSDLMGIFSGRKGKDLSELGPNAALRGKATGKVTLYGMPNCILSGDLAVYAKAYTHRSYHLPDGGTTATAERTGGYRSGSCVFRLSINETVEGQRKGVMASVPRLLVYVRERDLDPAVDQEPLARGL